jgi:thiol-disulfide isomerase/thioredoxin
MRLSTASLAILLTASAVAVGGSTTDPPVGEQAKWFVSTAVLNMPKTRNPLKALHGRVVLFTLFESWYEQCKDAVPEMNNLHDRYGPKGLTILACGAEEKANVEKFIADAGVKFAWAIIDTPTQEKFKRSWPAPGQPWGYLIDPDGKIVWQENPRNMQNRNVLKPGTLEPLLAAAWKAPILPKSLAEPQALLDDGLWAQAKKSLEAAAAGGALDKADAGWAKGVADWIEQRRVAYPAHADDLIKKGAWWDAWDMMNDFPRRFEGMGGDDVAKTKAEEIRKNPEAEKDLKVGDDVAKAKGYIPTKNYNGAKMILTRIEKETKGTRHADRARDLLELIPEKK